MENRLKERNGLLVVGREWSYSSDIFNEKNSGYTAGYKDFVEQHYKGFEGQQWPKYGDNLVEELGICSIEKIDKVLEYYHKLLDEGNESIDLIYFEVIVERIFEINKLNKFSFIGLDYGFYKSPWNFYSIIFNEIIWGQKKEMQRYFEVLNDYLLIPNTIDYNKIKNHYNELREIGDDFETFEYDEEPKSIGIWLYRK